MKKYIILAILLVSSIAFAYDFPAPNGYVNDFAGILSDTQSLEQELALYEQNTTIEIAVVTIDSLPSEYNLFTYGVDLFKEWGIGKKGEDNGILVLLMKNGTVGNRMRIELGYGVQGYITGAEAGRILDHALPFYEQGAYDTTAEVIVTELKFALADYVPGQIDSGYEDSLFDTTLFLIWALVFFGGIGFMLVAMAIAMKPLKCDRCSSKKFTRHGEYMVCDKCGKKIYRPRSRYAVGGLAGGGWSSGGGGGGGFGGGGSGGGGAGR